MTAKKQRCAKCQQALVDYSLVLYAGPNGFRCYALCSKCRAEVEEARNLEHEKSESR